MPHTKAKHRFFIYLTFLTVVVIIIVVYLFILMVFSPSNDQNIPLKVSKVERGPILDRNGRTLAIQTTLHSVEAWIPHIEDRQEVVTLLSNTLQLSKDYILDKLDGGSNSVFIKRKISAAESEKIQAYQEEGKLKGIYLRTEFGRIYPFQELAGHIIGYVGVDNIGLAGIEYSFDTDLSPSEHKGQGDTIIGNQIILTIDINLQYFIDKIAIEAYRENRADSVMILAMDATNGDILAYSAIPRFDPNNFLDYDSNELINRPLLYAYEPGSAFKIFSIATMLELQGITLEDTFYCEGFYEKIVPQGKDIHINCLGAHGEVTPQKIIEYSCNAGAAYASESVIAQDFYMKLSDFYFGKRTDLPLPGESYGIFHDPQSWSNRSKPTIAIGQEISVSAIQMLASATVFANKGLLLRPHIVKKIISPDGKIIKEYKREVVRGVVSPEVANQMLLIMETATQSTGTAKRAAIEGMRISAKTGTAQVPDPQTGEYSQDKYISSIIGIFPTDNPQIILYVVIQDPKGDHYYGSRIAAPVFKQAALEIISFLDILKQGDNVITHSGQIDINKLKPITIGSHLPDLTGLPKKLLLPLFLADIEVVIQGEGFVYYQSPEPGTKIKEGMKVIIKLR